MGYMIEITEGKAEELAEHAEKILKHGGKLMQCIEELCEEPQYSERGGYGRSGGRNGRMGERGYGRYGMREEHPVSPAVDPVMGERMGYREPWDDDPYMGERRGRSMTTGRYMRR